MTLELRRAIYVVVVALLAARVGSSYAHAAEYKEIVSQTPGVLAHYRFEKASDLGASRADASRARVEGEIRSHSDSAFPGLGRAIHLNGGSLTVPDLGRHDAFSIEFWIRLRERPEEFAAIYATDSWTRGSLHLNLRSNGAIEVAVEGAGTNPNTEPASLEPGEWAYIVAVYDVAAGTVHVYRNAKLLHEQEVFPQPSVTFSKGSIGAWLKPEPSRPLPAEIDEFAIYSRALKRGEIAAHYRAARGIKLVDVDFAREVSPLLTHHCLDCHGSETRESGLRLDVRDSALLGGESGEPAVVPFEADASELLRRITSKDRERVMPPGDHLTDIEIATLRNWIDAGASWPEELAGTLDPPAEQELPTHWSFQPLDVVEPPASDHTFASSGNPIDAFVFAELNKLGLEPSRVAEPRTLVRRLFLDVHGLPPTPDVIDQFATDPTSQSWNALVEQVLESPRYGERWASHWLDVIRYGDTHGFEVNTPRPDAWPYRDYVIKSLNEDTSFDQFIKEQIAGDQLGADAATGFLVTAPALLPGQVGKDVASMRQARQDELHEIIVSVGSGVLGLTIGCARCHDHKFDPIRQKDYYSLQAAFAGVRYGSRPVRNPEEVRLANGAGAPPASSVFAGVFSAPSPTYRLYRGDPMQRRERVAPDVPGIFGGLELGPTASDKDRRMKLAEWLVDPTNPLVPRVIVNRVWQHHFGTGLVETPSDFGASGRPPSHPELLDYLTDWFIENDRSLKRLHRLILTSNTYRQSNRPRAKELAVDADCRLLWRFPPRRLEMEPIRDSVLAVSGILDLSAGGPGFMLYEPNDNYVRVYEPKETWGPSEWRRMIYAHRVRMARDGVFGAFDCPDAGQPAPSRSRSMTAIQALNLLNSSFMQQQAELFASRASREADGDSSAIEEAFRLALGRTPEPEELADCRAVADEFGLPAVCLALFNSNEFLFLP